MWALRWAGILRSIDLETVLAWPKDLEQSIRQRRALANDPRFGVGLARLGIQCAAAG